MTVQSEEEFGEGIHNLNEPCKLCRGTIHKTHVDCPYCHSERVNLIVRYTAKSAQCQQCWQTFSPFEQEDDGIPTVNVADGTYKGLEACPYCDNKGTVLLVNNSKAYGMCRQCRQPFIPSSIPEDEEGWKPTKLY